MMQELNSKFLISRIVDSEDLKTNFKINFNQLVMKDYYKHRSENFISYQFYKTRFGRIIIGSTESGICYLHFINDEILAEQNFKSFFSDCNISKQESAQHQIALQIIEHNVWPEMLNLQVKGTDFQYKVWRGLTKIQKGQITTYSQLAKNLGIDGASRAVGSAIGSNEIAFLIPCHRVIQKTGKLAGFRWGDDLKVQLLNKELLEE
ncbi:methylated-DNA--[protein]-cysteine S-methyltransferase [Faecalibacter bovis]|uniref:Methylated-DNA--[protein]-cysteine S-methyltransferase n=1 Tax=Faecalibacter bovis TaxID=2898187 RepID=A0ABX7XCM0_9FLAO|nr:MGMT family protein [Faecalibacter bovis]QTV05654.1 methylated-DNA--[protein]-cysteine S-methyltransferase [Faecalibacter bovis]